MFSKSTILDSVAFISAFNSAPLSIDNDFALYGMDELFQIGLNYTIETTKSANTEANRVANNLFSQSNKWGLFFAAGPSSSFPLVSSSYITDIYPFLDDKSFPTIFPDIALWLPEQMIQPLK